MVIMDKKISQILDVLDLYKHLVNTFGNSPAKSLRL